MKEEQKIGIIGAGTVGTALAAKLSQKGYEVTAVCSRTAESAKRLAGRVITANVYSDAQGVADVSDLVFVTTPDAVIPGVASSVCWRKGQAVLHCSGADSLDILEPARRAGTYVGGFHPLQTFASIDQAIANLPGSTFALEADEPLLAVLKKMARDLGGHWVVLKAGDKVLYHAAAVMACNYVVTLTKLATDLWSTFGVDQGEATRALVPLLKGTLNNIETVGLPDCLTGPVARGDTITIKRHLAALQEKVPELLSTYGDLARQTIPISLSKGRIDSARAEEMRQVLSRREGGTVMRAMLKSKIHRARITEVNVDYEGSITIDNELIEAADIIPYEQVQVLDINNAARFKTYAIAGEGGSGKICVNGAAARLVAKGDTVIILTYSHVSNGEARGHRPSIVYVDSKNKIKHATTPHDSTDALIASLKQKV